MPETMISGLQLGLVDKVSRSISEWIELLNGTYVVASINGVEEFRVPAFKFPILGGSREWFEMGPRPLPFSKTRFDIPAFVYLNYRFVAQKR